MKGMTEDLPPIKEIFVEFTPEQSKDDEEEAKDFPPLTDEVFMN